MKLGQSYAEEIVDYYIIGPSLETAVLAQLRYGSAFTGNPQPQVARIISDNAVISAIGNKEVAQGVAEVAAGKRPYWLVMVRTKK